MASRIPVVRNMNYLYLTLQVAIMLLIILILFMVGIEQYLLLGIALYLLLSVYLKVLIPKWHRKGVYLLKKGKLELAILSFQRSYEYFTRYEWIDRYRTFTLFSTSNFSYKEMALMNIIYCFEQLGDRGMADKYHGILSRQYPNNRYSR